MTYIFRKAGAKIMIFAENGKSLFHFAQTGKRGTKTVQNPQDNRKKPASHNPYAHIISPETSSPAASASLIRVEETFTGGISMRRMR